MDNHNVRNEIQLLNQFDDTVKDEDIEWVHLKDDEKQLKRILALKSVKKTLLEENKDFFRFEESIIDLYEALTNCLDKISINQEYYDKNEFFIRLNIFLSLEKSIINQFKDVRRINNLNYTIAKALIYDCLNGAFGDFFLKKAGLLYFESKLDIAQWLLTLKKENA